MLPMLPLSHPAHSVASPAILSPNALQNAMPASGQSSDHPSALSAAPDVPHRLSVTRTHPHTLLSALVAPLRFWLPQIALPGYLLLLLLTGTPTQVLLHT